MQVVLVALEKRMLFDFEHDVQIAGWPTVRAGLALLRQTQADALIYTRRDVHFELPLDLLVTLAVALLARRADDLACPAALAAGAPHGEETLLVYDFAAARKKLNTEHRRDSEAQSSPRRKFYGALGAMTPILAVSPLSPDRA